MAKTSYIYNELLKLLGQSEQWADIRHLHTLIWMVIGLICSGTISLTKWTTYVNSRARFAQSHQRRFSRWLQNERINVQKLYSPIILMHYLKNDLGWHYRIRVKNDLWVLRPGKAACQLKQFHLNLGEAMLLQGVKITKSNVYGLVNLALARDPLSCELWYIVSDEKT
jgi:hypothetical protein